MMIQRTVNVYLTREVVEYLASHSGDQVIETFDECGGIFVHDAANLDNEGSGVWVDAAGKEHQGPNEGEFATSQSAIDHAGTLPDDRE